MTAPAISAPAAKGRLGNGQLRRQVAEWLSARGGRAAVAGRSGSRAPRPWPASRPPGRRSGASGRCSNNALGYAVELGRLASNPIDRIQWTAPPSRRPSTGAWWSVPPRPGSS